MDHSDTPVEPSVVVSTALSSSHFNLIPAIFVPFHGTSGDGERPRNRDERLKCILEDLDKHHDKVRRNMIFLTNVHKEKLISDARDAVTMDESLNGPPGMRFKSTRSIDDEQDIESILESLKTRSIPGLPAREYEYKDGDISIPEPRQATGLVDADGDAHMAGSSHEESHPSNIPHELAIALQKLVSQAKSEMEGYDTHTAATKQFYQTALERSTAREINLTDTAVMADWTEGCAEPTERIPGGILKKRNEATRVGTASLTRKADETTKSLLDRLPTNVVDSSRDPRRR